MNFYMMRADILKNGQKTIHYLDGDIQSVYIINVAKKKFLVFDMGSTIVATDWQDMTSELIEEVKKFKTESAKKTFKMFQNTAINFLLRIFQKDQSVVHKLSYCNWVYNSILNNENFAVFFVSRYDLEFIVRNFLHLTHIFFSRHLFEDDEECLGYRLTGERLADMFINEFNLHEITKTVRDYFQSKSLINGFDEYLTKIEPYKAGVDYTAKELQNIQIDLDICKPKITK